MSVFNLVMRKPSLYSAVLEGLAQAKAGQFATDEEVEAAFRRFEQSKR